MSSPPLQLMFGSNARVGGKQRWRGFPVLPDLAFGRAEAGMGNASLSVAQARETYSLLSREGSAWSRLREGRPPGAYLGQLLPSLCGYLPFLLTVHLVSQEKDGHLIRPCILHTERIPQLPMWSTCCAPGPG